MSNYISERHKQLETYKLQLKEAVVEFSRLKDKIIFEELGIHIMDEKDIAVISKWSFKSILKVAYGLNAGNDNSFCPFCALHTNKDYKINCNICSYAKHHGECNIFNNDNQYKTVIDAICLKSFKNATIAYFIKYGINNNKYSQISYALYNIKRFVILIEETTDNIAEEETKHK